MTAKLTMTAKAKATAIATMAAALVFATATGRSAPARAQDAPAVARTRGSVMLGLRPQAEGMTIGRLAGAWRVTGVAVPPDGVQALTRDDPAYMGRRLEIGQARIAWAIGRRPAGDATLDDVCTGPGLAPDPGGTATTDAGLAAELQSIGFRAGAGYLVRCARGGWGPPTDGHPALYVAGPDLIAMPWYDGALLKLARDRR